MPTARTSPILRYVYAVSGAASPNGLPDRDLLERFARRGDDAAFTLLVRRHGPMVLGVCRRVARDTHDADDAFQATFLLLARKAGCLRQPELVGPWLHGVARRTATKARMASIRRRQRQTTLPDLPATSADECTWRDLRPVLDDAIDQLPARYRTPFVLCYLQGLTYAQAARRLGCPPGTVATRLTRAKEKLRVRLTRLGLAPAAGLLAVGANEVTAAVHPALIAATVRAAVAFVAGPAVGVVSSSVLVLTEGVGKAMLANSWKVVLVAFGTAGVIGTGASAWTYRTPAAETSVMVPARQPPPPHAVKTGPEQPPAAEPLPPPVTHEEPRASSKTIRTTNFLVSAPTPELAQRFGQAAEQCRKEMAIEWLGEEMPQWPRPCPLYVKPKPGGSGGATKFTYDFRGSYEVLSMEIEGDVEQMLISCLPHEVTHTVFAHYFRYPVPRWADEGGSVLSESDRERYNHDRMCREKLNRHQGIPLRRLFTLKEYGEVSDAMIVFAQGYSVTQYLVDQRGRQTFLEFVKSGLSSDWDKAVKQCYKFESVEALEDAWKENLRQTKGTVIRAPKDVGVTTELQISRAWVDEEGRLAVRVDVPVIPPPDPIQNLPPQYSPPKQSNVPTNDDPNVPNYTWTYNGTTPAAKRYPLPDVHGYRVMGDRFEEVELRALAQALRRETPVVVCYAVVPQHARQLLLSVVKDGTIILVLPRQ
jgi:RNA polymerase sigma factor (sigma-70 family)